MRNKIYRNKTHPAGFWRSKQQSAHDIICKSGFAPFLHQVLTRRCYSVTQGRKKTRELFAFQSHRFHFTALHATRIIRLYTMCPAL